MSAFWQIFSYIIDWVVVIIIAGVGAALYKIRGNSHPFALSDPAIAYPYIGDTISIATVGIVALAVPAVITAILSLLIKVPRVSSSSGERRPSQLRGRLWEWHSAWLGLVVAVAGAFCLTSALKDIIGKPRPNLLARCQPDVTRIQEFTVGGFGTNVQGAPILVSIGICQNTDMALVYDGFAAIPSGHSSVSFAGLLYLTLWILHKFAVIPIDRTGSRKEQTWNDNPAGSRHNARNIGAASPSLILVTAALVPVVGAACIAGTRWLDNQHSGWDIVAGSLLGSGFAWLGFRLYHPSLFGQSSSAWAARDDSAAFWPARQNLGYDLELGSIPPRTAH